MTHSTIREDGKVTYRTSLFVHLARAQAFAKCISANSRFESVLVHASTTAKTPKWFVTFLPTNSDRADALHQAQWDARANRAATEEFLFWPDCDVIGLWWCFSVASGETYETTIFGCTCPDYTYRCQKAGILCKHQHAWSQQKRDGLLGKTDKTSFISAERRLEIAQAAIASMDISRDF